MKYNLSTMLSREGCEASRTGALLIDVRKFDMKNGSEYQYGTSTTTYLSYQGVSFSSATVTSFVKTVDSGSVIKGDRKTPNPFWFQKVMVRGYRRFDIQQGYLAGKPYRTELQSSSEVSMTSGLQPLYGTDFQRTYDRCLDKIFDQMRGNSDSNGNNPNLIVDAVESGQTIQMIRKVLSLKKLAKEFYKRVIKTKAYKRKPRSERIQYVSDKWLEVRYGWMPLMSSIYDTVKTLGRKVEAAMAVLKARSGVSTSDVFVTGSGTYTSPTIKTEVSRSWRTELQLVYNRPAGTSLYNYTSLNPLAIAWEVTPFSFVVDWVVDVGGLLERWENFAIFASSASNIRRTDSYREIVTQTVSGTSYTPPTVTASGSYPNQTNILSKGSQSTAVRTGLNRATLITLPTPGIKPRINFRMGAKQFADSAALLSQVFKGWGLRK